MFGIDSSEFLLIAVVALLVIGPKDLPRVMRLVGGWVGRGRAMTRHLRSGFDTMMREAELEEMQKQWAKQNAEIMAATVPAVVAAHGHDMIAPHVADAVVGEQVYDHPGALPVAEAPQSSDCHPRDSEDPMPDGVTLGSRFRGEDGLAGKAVAVLMTGPQPAAHSFATPAEPAIPEPAPIAQP